ncbi:MAG: hypothetical protein Q7S04_01355 [Candidatus Moranbacteria bacterium]|nr:hypothetical protein [Candidatus Moranbacteria bacterium]
MKQITKRQREVLMEIYNLTQQGLPPTFAELRKKLGVSSNQTIKDFINILSAKEYIRQESNKARAISISDKGFEEINNANKKTEFAPNIDLSAVLSISTPNQNINNSANFSDNIQEVSYNIKFNN